MTRITNPWHRNFATLMENIRSRGIAGPIVLFRHRMVLRARCLLSVCGVAGNDNARSVA